MPFFNLDFILSDVAYHLDFHKPFSLIRLGDGDYRIIYEFLELPEIENTDKMKQQGLPPGPTVLNIYRKAATLANYLSNLRIYDGIKFWERKFSRTAKRLVKTELSLLTRLGVPTKRMLCNPEINFLFFLESRSNLLEVLKDKKICLVTCYKGLEGLFKDKCHECVSLIIPGRYQNHYDSYDAITNNLIELSSSFDVFLIGGGTLGRGYSTTIKECGSVAIDIGRVFDAWETGKIPNRLKGYIQKTNDIEFSLTKKSANFLSLI